MSRLYERRAAEPLRRSSGPAKWLVNATRPGHEQARRPSRFTDAAGGRPSRDVDTTAVITGAAKIIGAKAFELEWLVWEAARGGASRPPSAPPESTRPARQFGDPVDVLRGPAELLFDVSIC